MPSVLVRLNCQEICSPRIMPMTSRPILFSSTGRHETRLKIEPVVGHGKSAAGQLRRAHKPSAHGLALFNRREGKTPLGRELAPGPLHLLLLKSQDEIDSQPPRAVGCSRGMALPDQ